MPMIPQIIGSLRHSGMPAAPPAKAEPAPAGLSAASLKLWLAATYYRRRADELAPKDSRVSL